MVDERRMMETIVSKADYEWLEELYFDSDGKIWREYGDFIDTKREVLDDQGVIKWIRDYVEFKNKEIESELKNNPDRFKMKTDVEYDDEMKEEIDKDKGSFRSMGVTDYKETVKVKVKAKGLVVNDYDVLTMKGVINARKVEIMEKVCMCGHFYISHIDGNCYLCECKAFKSALTHIDQITGEVKE